MKVVINKCYGGFGLSEEAYKFLGVPWDGFGHGEDIERNCSKLIECVEKLGEKANGSLAELKIVEIPDNVKYEIEDYDGVEWIAEEHRTWS